MPSAPHGAPRAFSLVECLIAVSIMAVLTLPIVTAQRLAHRGNLSARRHVEALFLAHEVIERLRHENDRFCAGAGLALPLPPIALPEGFTLDVKRRPVADELLEATVTVSWSLGGQTRSTRSSTLLSLRPASGSLLEGSP